MIFMHNITGRGPAAAERTSLTASAQLSGSQIPDIRMANRSFFGLALVETGRNIYF